MNYVNDTTKAFVQGATLSAGRMDVTAEHGGYIGSLTAGAAGASGDEGTAVAGSVSADVILTDTEAYLSDVRATLSGDSDVSARECADIYSVAGAGAFGGEGGYGISAAVDLIGVPGNAAKTLAYITGSTVSLTGAGTLSVTATDADADADAQDAPRIVSVAGAIGVGTGDEGDAGAGMFAINLIYGETDAYLQSSTVTQPSSPSSAASLDVSADDSWWILAIGGAVGASEGTGVGAAISYNNINDATRAAIDASTVSVGGSVTVSARDQAIIADATVGVGISAGDDGFAGAGSISVNIIGDTTDAHISAAASPTSATPTASASSVTAGGSISATADDAAVIASVAGGVAVADDGPAIGAAVAYNAIDDVVTGYINDATVDSAGSSVTVSAQAGGSVFSLAVGAAITAGDSPAIQGSLSINSIADDVDAHVSDGSSVTAAGNVSVTAGLSAGLYVLSGGAAISADGVGVGASLAYNFLGGSYNPLNPTAAPTVSGAANGVTAYISNSSVLAGAASRSRPAISTRAAPAWARWTPSTWRRSRCRASTARSSA